MNWLVLALLSASIAASINHIDKYLIEKYLKGGGIGSLVIFSSLMGLPVFLLIAFFVPEALSLNYKTALPIILNGIIYVSWLLPYFYALEKDETSVVTPLFQMAPVFSFLLGYLFLGESLSLIQFLASIMIILGSIGLSLEFAPDQKVSFKKDVYFLMFLASILVAINGVLFKYFAMQESFWVASFWEYVGFFVAAVFLFIFARPYRQQFIEIIKLNKMPVLNLNFINEVLAMLSKITINYAFLLAPVALVFFVAEGFQPFFVLFFGVLLTIFLPKIAQEDLGKKYLVRKTLSIITMLLGVYLLVL